MISTTTRTRTRRTAGFLAAGAVALAALTGCGAAEDAAQAAKDAAADKASQAVADASRSASAQISDAATKVFTDQMCTLVKDGSLTAGDSQALDGLLTAGEAAGLPADLVTLARSVAGAGADAGQEQVDELKAKVCPAG